MEPDLCTKVSDFLKKYTETAPSKENIKLLQENFAELKKKFAESSNRGGAYRKRTRKAHTLHKRKALRKTLRTHKGKRTTRVKRVTRTRTRK